MCSSDFRSPNGSCLAPHLWQKLAVTVVIFRQLSQVRLRGLLGKTTRNCSRNNKTRMSLILSALQTTHEA